ncbi:DUF3592 domain-containing protein [Aquipuribacter sp. SD81]|uniref:DUF3592 domain-containing protein n=1 Tax=Aquipuribacter sp. SD81 TaxID=3127703 RepID=UPI0030198D9B
MSRTARAATGAALVGVLLLVAAVAAVVAATAGSGPGGAWADPFFLEEDLSATAEAEVLDVDEGDDWVDVRWTTEDDETVVTGLDWSWSSTLPEVGDSVTVVYDPADPEWSSYAAEDPWVELPSPADEVPDASSADVTAAAAGVVRAAGWTALGALGAAVLAALVTVVAVVRAPAAPRPPSGPVTVAPGWAPPGPWPPAPPHPGPGPHPAGHQAAQPAAHPVAQPAAYPQPTGYPRPGPSSAPPADRPGGWPSPG